MILTSHQGLSQRTLMYTPCRFVVLNILVDVLNSGGSQGPLRETLRVH